MANRHGFIAAGCWTLDRIKLIDNWPEEESLATIENIELQGGGSGHNAGVDLKKLDSAMPVYAIGLVGEDADGEFLHSRAIKAGIDTTQLHHTDKAATSFTDVMSVVPTGKRTFFHNAGTNDLLTPDHFDFSQCNARWLHLGLLGVHKTLDNRWQQQANGWVAVLQKAQQAGLKTNIEMVSINAERSRDICLPCLPHLDSLIVNDHEIGSLAQIETIIDGVACADACESAAIKVLGMGGMQLVVVHYPSGAVCVTREGQCHRQAALNIDAADIIGSNGAGDAFAAGMLYGLHEHWSIENSMQLAHATAAASLRSATTVDSVGTVAENLSQC